MGELRDSEEKPASRGAAPTVGGMRLPETRRMTY